MTRPEYDVVIVGAGPTGLAAAVYTGREDLKTAVLESDVAGGLIATTEVVDNLPGFPEGIGGIELGDRLVSHAKRFGAEILTNHKVTGITKDKHGLTVATTQGPIAAKVVLVATGAHYRHLEVPGEKELIGRGVHYCATCDGPFYRDREVVVVGGGNSALQEGLFLAKFASKLTFLVRGPAFKGSPVLQERVAALPNSRVIYNTEIISIEAKDNMFGSVTTRHKETKVEQKLTGGGLFAFVGVVPNTDFLPPEIELDVRGFVVTGRDFKTSMPGVYAAGDVCQGTTGQVATAVGDGVAAAITLGHYLAG